MSSVLDIIQSIVIAGIIAVMVLGVHLMTMKSSSENQVIQQLQGTADMAVTILQEEIRSLHSFVSDSVRVNSNSIYFRDPEGTLVYIEAFQDTLSVVKVNRGTELHNGVVHYFSSSNALRVMDNPTISPGSLIMIVSQTSEAETKLVKSYNSNLKRVEIKGEWDMTFPVSTGFPKYFIYEATQVESRTYHLRLLDRSNDGIHVFNLVEWGAGGVPVNTSDVKKDMKNIDLIRVNISIGSTPDQLYEDTQEEFIVDLQKDFFLRGYRLPSPGG